MAVSISFGMVDIANDRQQPKKITGRMINGFACIEFRGLQMDLVLKGFSQEQLEMLQRVASRLAGHLAKNAG
jgi:hypothetical protein